VTLLLTSWSVVRRGALLVPAAAALAFVLVTWSALAGPAAAYVMLGVAVLLSCGLASTLDDPAGEVLAASPYPRSVRVGARVAGGLAVVVPAWVVVAVVVHQRQPVPGPSALSLGDAGLQALVLGLVAVAVGAAGLAWTGSLVPSTGASVVVVVVALAAGALPARLGLGGVAQIRTGWLVVALLACLVVHGALRDPLHRSRGSVLGTHPARRHR
jgi:hypothetical protein